MSSNLEKRTWAYVNSPAKFGIPDCKCGSAKVGWSEYKDHLWCFSCEKDFQPEHWGVFDGPIMFEMAELLGMDFDIIDLTRDVYQKQTIENGEFVLTDLNLISEVLARREELEEKSRAFMEKAGFEVV